MKKTLSFILVLFFSIPVFCKISFNSFSINNNDELVFSLSQDMVGVKDYTSLLYTKIINGQAEENPTLITCFPEQMELLNNNSILQIRNRFGKAQYNIQTKTFKWTSPNESLPQNFLPLSPYSVSSDGKYLCKIQKQTLTSGSLILCDVNTNKEVVLCTNVKQNYESVPIKWSPNNSVLLYEKEGNIYFCKPDAVIKNIEMDEKYRKIGRGSINSVEWANDSSFIYIDDYLVYQINSKELYTIGLYSGIIGQGKAIGRLPFGFNAYTDKFSVDSRINALLLIQNNRLISYMRFQKGSLEYMDVVYSKPYIDSTASLINTHVFWNKNSEAYLWLEMLPFSGTKQKSIIYNVSSKLNKILEITNSTKPLLSPDGTKIIVCSDSTVYVYDCATWQIVSKLEGEKLSCALWASNDTIFVGGEKTIKEWKLQNNQTSIIMLSSAKSGCFDATEQNIVAVQDNDVQYIFNKKSGTWSQIEPFTVAQSSSNGRYRIFVGKTSNKKFVNALYIRSLTKSQKVVTKALYKESVTKNPESKKITLVIDAYDNADGLTKIIYALKKYNIPVCFFLNGEFIRRYPSETKQIVNNGYDVSSMFFSSTDLINNPFIIDEEFVRRGLARNEDEFFNCTGKELLLYWHAPYYSSNPKIESFGQKAGYTYVSTNIKENDSTELDKELKPESLIYSYCETLKKNNGGIVPLCTGFAQGRRIDPLYNYIDILICALMDSGFEFVPITDL